LIIGGTPPTAVVTGTATICNGDSTVVQATLGGSAGPWNVIWSSNGIPVETHFGVVATNDTLNVSPSDPNPNAVATHTYTVSALTDVTTGFAGTDLTGSAVVTVNPRPTSVVSGDATICNGETTVIQAALTGIGPWTVTWSDGFVQTNTAALGSGVVATRVVSTNNPLANLATNYTYTVTELRDAHCTGSPSDRTGNAVVTVNP